MERLRGWNRRCCPPSGGDGGSPCLLSPRHPAQSDGQQGGRGGRCPPGSPGWQRGDKALLGYPPRPAGTHAGPPRLTPPPQHPTSHQHLAAALSPAGCPGSQQIPWGPGRSPGSPQSHAILSPSPGYYYDLDDSCDDSDEEEVRAHLRCVAEQPPLKLDTSSEVQRGTRRPLSPPHSPWEQPLLGHQLPVLRCSHHPQPAAEVPGGSGMGTGTGPGVTLLCSPPRRPRSWSSCSSSASPRSSRRRNC